MFAECADEKDRFLPGFALKKPLWNGGFCVLANKYFHSLLDNSRNTCLPAMPVDNSASYPQFPQVIHRRGEVIHSFCFPLLPLRCLKKPLFKPVYDRTVTKVLYYNKANKYFHSFHRHYCYCY